MGKKSQRQKPRRSRASVQPFVDVLTEWGHDCGFQYEIGGSWRRGRPTVADLDVVVFTRDLDSVILPLGYVAERRGRKISQGTLWLETPDGNDVADQLAVDFWACSLENRGPMLWFITGPKDLNVYMRSVAQSQGRTLAQEYLSMFSLDKDHSDERAISDELGLVWIDPADRDDWRSRWLTPRLGQVHIRSGDNIYTLTQTDHGATCTCPGFVYRQDCKHVRNPEEFQ